MGRLPAIVLLAWNCLIALGEQACWADAAVSGQFLPTVPESPGYGWEIAKIALFLGCLGGLLWLLRFLSRQPWLRRGPANASRSITVLANHYLDPKKSLVLVEVEGQRLLLANLADNLKLLTVWPLQDVPSRSEAAVPSEAPKDLHATLL